MIDWYVEQTGKLKLSRLTPPLLKIDSESKITVWKLKDKFFFMKYFSLSFMLEVLFNKLASW